MNTGHEPAGTTTNSVIEHRNVPTGLLYDALVSAFESELGKWDPEVESRLVAQKAPWGEVEREVARLGGARGLMIIAKIDQGTLTSLSGVVKRCSLYLVGNPAIANRILDVDPRAALLVPFRVCLYDGGAPGGAVISYDRPSSFMAAMNHPELAEIGAQLDGKIDGVAQALVALADSDIE